MKTTNHHIDPAKLPRNEQAAYYYRGLRTRMGYSQAQFAKRLGVNIRTVQRRENAEIYVTYECLMAALYIFVRLRGYDPMAMGGEALKLKGESK